MTERVSLSVLGVPEMRKNDAPLPLPSSRKAQALLFYVAVTDGSPSRDALASLLWSDKSQKAARANLRKALQQLRDHFAAHVGELPLSVESNAIGFQHSENFWVDVVELERIVPATDQSADPDRLRKVLELCRGRFLEDFEVRAAPLFSDWAGQERDRLDEIIDNCLDRLSKHFVFRGDRTQAIYSLRQRLVLKPWNEEVHRELIRLLIESGRETAALAQFEKCRQVLAEELAIQPSSRTLALYHQIVQARGESDEPESKLHTALDSVPHNLPPQPTPFVGRKNDLDKIVNRLLDPANRMISLIGFGGVGKTRLALQAAEMVRAGESGHERFKDGYFFVPLASIDSESGLLSSLIDVLDLEVHHNQSLRHQLLRILRDKRVLIILDSFEHVLDARTLLSDILDAGDGITFLITSRAALVLRHELLYRVEGMTLPLEESDADESHDGYDAIQLFVQSAQRLDHDCVLTGQGEAVVKICRMVAGIPLAIELSASWLKVLSANEIAHELERGIDLLNARNGGVPARHQSIQTVLDYSWRLLSEEERNTLLKLAVFHGSFDRDAAQKVTGASLTLLAALTDKTMLQRTTSNRYQLHDLMHKYLVGKWRDTPHVGAGAQVEHARYYAELLNILEDIMMGRDQSVALNHIEREIENICAAWNWAVKHGQWQIVDRAENNLYRYFWMRGRAEEGWHLFTSAITRLRAEVSETEQLSLKALCARMINKLAVFTFALGEHNQAQELNRECLEYLHRLDDERSYTDSLCLANTLCLIGLIDGMWGQERSATRHLEASLKIFRSLSHRSGAADSLAELALVKMHFGSFDLASQLAQESLELSLQLGRSDWIAHAHNGLGQISLYQGRYLPARHHFMKGYKIFESIDHHVGQALTIHGMGLLNLTQDNAAMEQASQYFLQSLEILRRIGHRQYLSGLLSDLALYASLTAQHDLAYQYSYEGWEYALEIGSPLLACRNLCCLGSAASGLGDYQASRGFLKQALHTSSTFNIPPLHAVSLYQIALLLIRESNSDAVTSEERQRKWEDADRLLTSLGRKPKCWNFIQNMARSLQADLRKCNNIIED